MNPYSPPASESAPPQPPLRNIRRIGGLLFFGMLNAIVSGWLMVAFPDHHHFVGIYAIGCAVILVGESLRIRWRNIQSGERVGQTDLPSEA